MHNVVPLYRTMHVLFVDNDWVIRQILQEHFATDANCRAVSFPDADRALGYLRELSGVGHIFSNIDVGGRAGIDLSTGPDRQTRIELAIAPGYDSEQDRFQAIEADLGFFRVKPFTFNHLWQVLQHAHSQSFYH